MLVLLADRHRYDALGAAAKLYGDEDSAFGFGSVAL